jgi:hypothetical protein
VVNCSRILTPVATNLAKVFYDWITDLGLLSEEDFSSHVVVENREKLDH